MNLQTLRARLSKVERQRIRLEQQIQKNAKRQFDSLPARVGLKSIDDLIIELLPYASPSVRAKAGSNGSARPVGRPRKNATASAGAAAREKSRGVRYTAETKDAIKAALEKGGMTVAQISEKFGASSFSINQWKKRWGLTKARKKK
jgi:hypothetical protein